MSAAALQLDLLDLAPARRPPLRVVARQPISVQALAPGGRTPSGDIAGPAGGRLTLDDVLVGAWEGLLARRTVRCPVCEAEAMSLASGGGRCASCHARLS